MGYQPVRPQVRTSPQGVASADKCVGGITAAELAEQIDEIGTVINALGISHGDPDRFHILKDDAAKRCRALATKLRGGQRLPPQTIAAHRAAMAKVIAEANLKRGPSRR